MCESAPSPVGVTGTGKINEVAAQSGNRPRARNGDSAFSAIIN